MVFPVTRDRSPLLNGEALKFDWLQAHWHSARRSDTKSANARVRAGVGLPTSTAWMSSMSPGLKSSRIGTNRPAPLSSATLNALTVGACLTSVLEEAARYYATNPVATGCLAPEGTRSNDEQAREAARAFNRAAEGVIHASIATRHPEDAQRLTDFVSTTMSGPSAKARNGHGLDQLLATARLAALL